MLRRPECRVYVNNQTKNYEKFTEVSLIVHSLLGDANPTTAAIFAYFLLNQAF